MDECLLNDESKMLFFTNDKKSYAMIACKIMHNVQRNKQRTCALTGPMAMWMYEASYTNKKPAWYPDSIDFVTGRKSYGQVVDVVLNTVASMSSVRLDISNKDQCTSISINNREKIINIVRTKFDTLLDMVKSHGIDATQLVGKATNDWSMKPSTDTYYGMSLVYVKDINTKTIFDKREIATFTPGCKCPETANQLEQYAQNGFTIYDADEKNLRKCVCCSPREVKSQAI